MIMKKKIFNLEFPPRCNEFRINGYKFYRVDNYETQLKKLQHRSNVISEFNITQRTGGHSITAYVELPEIEEQSVLEWKEENSALKDILLLISIFTGRDVFDVEENFDENGDFVIQADPKLFQFGKALSLSFSDEEFGRLLNKIYELIKSEEWRSKYSGGYFLLLAKQAFKDQILETSFILSWTIMEHIYYILNHKNTNKDEMDEDNKYKNVDVVLYMLTEFNFISIMNAKIKKRIWLLSDLRNKLIHYGRFPKRNTIIDEALLFIEIIEIIIAKTLNLTPSNMSDTVRKLKEFLRLNPNI